LAAIFHNLGLDKPYPFDISPKQRMISAFVFSTFVVLFLFIFKPFQIGNFHEHTLIVSLGYGLICLLIMLFLNLVFVKVVPRYFNENKWTTGRQIFWTLINVFIIGFGNFIFSISLKIIPLSVWGIIQFQFFTLTVGVFPVVISALLNQARLQTLYTKNSNEMNVQLIQQTDQIISKNNDNKEMVTIPSLYAQENLQLEAEDILFVRAADNYIEVYYSDDHGAQRILLRNTLKSVEGILVQGHFFRCHKSYLVNLNKVIRVSGNAQGYRLHIEKIDEPIPVSRIYNQFLKNHFANRP